MGQLIWQQAVNRDLGLGGHIDLAIRDGGRRELNGSPCLIARVWRLVAAVELGGDVVGIISIENCRIGRTGLATVQNPDDAIGVAIR